MNIFERLFNFIKKIKKDDKVETCDPETEEGSEDQGTPNPDITKEINVSNTRLFKNNIKKLANDEELSEEDEDEDENETIPQDKKTSGEKTRRIIIYVFVILGIIYFTYDEYINFKEGEIEKKAKVIAPKKKEIKPSLFEDKSIQKEKEEPSILVVPKENIPPQEANNKDESSIENPDESEVNFDLKEAVSEIDQDKNNSIGTKSEDDDQVNIPTSKFLGQDNVNDKKSNSHLPPSQNNEQIQGRKISNQEVDTLLAPNQIETSPEKTSHDFEKIMDEIKSVELDQKPEDKIEAVKEEFNYLVTPDYESLGRGLVYNCEDKYWACVNKEEYFQCKNLQIHAKTNLSTSSCLIFEVYSSDEDCVKVQAFRIHQAEKIDCQ